MPLWTFVFSTPAFCNFRTKEIVSLLAAGADDIRVPCSDAAVTPCGTATSPELGPVAAPAGPATADEMITDPAAPAAIKVPTQSRLDQCADVKVDPPV
jgi:hypothetical protein